MAAEVRADTREIGWAPFPGGQEQFLSCTIKEIFIEGNRGGGKTEILLIKFLRHVGKYGPVWRGVIFRREYKHLDDLVAKSKRLFGRLGIKATWLSSKSDYKWVFATGEELLFRAMKDPEDYWNYHGHELPFIAWEELPNYPNDLCYERMRSCSRCSQPGVPKYYLSSGNPYGAGHGWVKARFIDIGPSGTVVADEHGNQRVRIHVDLEDNQAMMENDQEYIQLLEGIESEALRKAWRSGDWNIVVGGFLQGKWSTERHICKPFPIPDDWVRWRAMDWGFGNPYSIGWYALDPVNGVIYRYRELYGWGGKPNVGSRESPEEVSAKILELERAETERGIKFKNSVADNNIWTATSLKVSGQEVTIAELFRKAGVPWNPARKGPGSRVSGAQVVVQHLVNGTFKVFDTCKHFIRTVPGLMPDPDNWEDVDTEQEDHVWDEFRYSLVSRHKALSKLDEKKEPEPFSYDWLLKYGGEPEKPPSVYRP